MGHENVVSFVVTIDADTGRNRCCSEGRSSRGASQRRCQRARGGGTTDGRKRSWKTGRQEAGAQRLASAALNIRAHWLSALIDDQPRLVTSYPRRPCNTKPTQQRRTAAAYQSADGDTVWPTAAVTGALRGTKQHQTNSFRLLLHCGRKPTEWNCRGGGGDGVGRHLQQETKQSFRKPDSIALISRSSN